ncbi:putative AAA family ATPase [Fonsecaea pedrosoi]|nr:putative AAA family ATPase [Fonsecaea pedrosoi]
MSKSEQAASKAGERDENSKPKAEEPNQKKEEQVTEDKPKGPPVAKGSINEAKALYSKKDQDGKDQWVTEEPVDVVEAAENEETAKFAFLVRKQKSYDSRKKYDIHSIIVQSPWLKKSLGVILEDYPGITTNLDRLVFRAPFHPFVHRWDKLTSLLEEDNFEEDIARAHLKLFRDTLFEELENAIAAKIDLVKNEVVTFEYLWTIFEPQTLVYSMSDGKECVFKLNSSSRVTDSRRGLELLQLEVWSVDWDGDKFGQHVTYLSNYEFPGTTPITSLQAYPLKFHPEKEQLMLRLVARGKLFERLAGYHYKAYRGVALGYGRCGMIRHNVESRIIIDCDAHNRFLPNNAVYFNSLFKSTNQINGLLSDESEEQSEQFDFDGFLDNESDYLATPDSGDDACSPKHRPLTMEELLLAVPYVRGYALKTKKWLWFYVDQVEEIKFADNAFASLVLPKEQKSLIRAFVESQVKYKDDFDDVITGKGRGMIMLLAGPPGVGKTLTSESVAEDMRVPLRENKVIRREPRANTRLSYMMSAGDLGLDPSGIEESLNLVLDMVSKWNAVLLLDEADVFLEARSSNDLERNKMVSIFLRVLPTPSSPRSGAIVFLEKPVSAHLPGQENLKVLDEQIFGFLYQDACALVVQLGLRDLGSAALEYYEGVLFLTTNRITNIDEAFHSRIHVTVNYPSLSVESRRHIWQTFLGADHPVSGKDLERLARVELNGRQIKNILKTSQMLARSEGTTSSSSNQEPTKGAQRGPKVELRHIETILAIEQRGTSWQP